MPAAGMTSKSSQDLLSQVVHEPCLSTGESDKAVTLAVGTTDQVLLTL